MSESAALARALAAQLGDDLDRILGDDLDRVPGDDGGQNAPTFEVAERRPPTSLELRQVAGLSAGFTLPLPPGTHQFGAGSGSPAGDQLTRPFTITVDEELRAWITTDANVRLDGHTIRSRLPVDDAVIDAGSARFVVSQSRPPARRRNGAGARVSVTSEPPPVIQRIRIADYAGEAPPAPAKKRRFGLRASDTDVDTTTEPLIDRILELRSLAVSHERRRFPDLGQLKQMAEAGADHMGYIDVDDENFARVPVANGDLAWQPPIDRPDRIPRHLVAAVQQQAILPSVPLTANLAAEHLGIVGPRDACMAVVRQIAVTLRVMSPIDAITFTLLRSEGARSDWEWLDQLPVGSGRGLPVMFFDGMRQVTEFGMRQELLEQGSGGGVIVDDQVRDIPSLCSTVLEIQPSGGAALLDFRRGATTTRVATPLGFDMSTTMEFVRALG